MKPPDQVADERPDLRLKTFLAHGWQSAVRWDGPTWRSLRRLVSSPGRLAADHFEAANQAQIHPLRLYLAINIVFFLLAPWLHLDNAEVQLNVWSVDHRAGVELVPPLGAVLDRQIERSGIDGDVYRAVLDHRMRAQQGAFVWLLIPFVALGSWVAIRQRRRFLVEHVVLATNLVSFFLVSLLAASLVARLLMAIDPRASSPPVLIAALGLLAWIVWLPITIYRGVRAFFDLRWWSAAMLTVWLGLAFGVGTLVYLVVLFVASLLGLRDLHLPLG